jgi:hypothetical protein
VRFAVSSDIGFQLMTARKACLNRKSTKNAKKNMALSPAGQTRWLHKTSLLKGGFKSV